MGDRNGRGRTGGGRADIAGAERDASAAPSAVSGGARRARGRQGVDAIVRELQSTAEWRDRMTHWHEVPARPGRVEPLPAGLHPKLAAVLQARGLHEVYEHQARAIEAAVRGEDVLVATPTASGKTLCYTVPVTQALLETQGSARALFLFPTKALSQDQSAGLTRLVEELDEPWHAYTYDGDTPPSVRRTLRDRGHLVLTNPWMLHQGILPNHSKWSELFADLRYIVIDEVHTLSGVFGSSVAGVLRRLVRIARHYGSDPRFLCCSATLREPGRHAERLLGRPVEVVEEDTSPVGRRVFCVHNPPMVNPVAGLRASALEEARKLAQVVCGPEHQTIFFCNRRTAVEVLTRYLKEGASRLGLRPEEIRGYRGGYLPLLRREIETGLRSGEVKVVVTTNALELGIDIGSLDACVLVGYPGSQASFWQRVGRVGRRGKESLAVLIARSDPVDQYLARHPETLFGPPREKLGLDPDNLVILSEQLKCAAFELPFTEAELADPRTPFGRAPHAADILDYLAEESKLLLRRGDTWYWMADAYPAQDVGLAGDDIDNVVILDAETGKALGEVDRADSITEVHEGAMYLVEGETWKVERFDYKNRRAYLRKVETDYFTEAQTDVEVRVVRLEQKAARGREDCPIEEPWTPGLSGDAEEPPELPRDGEDCAIHRGEVHVKTVATQFKKVRFYTRENVGADDIHLPPEELDTEAFVLTLSMESAVELGLVGGDRGSAWRAVGVLLKRVAPLYLRCQARDLGLSSQVRSTHFRRPALFLFDRVQGGVGLSEALFREHRSLVEAALDVVQGCDCEHGCPACVGPVEEVGPLGKETAARILEHLARAPRLADCEPEADADTDTDDEEPE